MKNKHLNKWVLIFFDMAGKDFTKRVRLLRQFKSLGAAMHSQSVYCIPYTPKVYKKLKTLRQDLMVVKGEVSVSRIGVLVDAYDSFIRRLFEETETKIEELEDANALASESASRKRGYSKRLSSLSDRLAHLDYVSSLRQDDDIQDAVDAFRVQVQQIENRETGKGY
ncbi:hypothetical protein CMI37_06065 [Candidatus Pacearchaeota archaeon]|nr:hypothetical protein [Candidatus Pacearchaeota archaeon]|tara:strand:- start:261 stop:761 length:501 start_codon:yes stop_codon:yes gene_type:complete